MPRLPRWKEVHNIRQEGYNAAYDGRARAAVPRQYVGNENTVHWLDGYDLAKIQMKKDQDHAARVASEPVREDVDGGGP